jgi:hypothetical protein
MDNGILGGFATASPELWYLHTAAVPVSILRLTEFPLAR